MIVPKMRLPDIAAKFLDRIQIQIPIPKFRRKFGAEEIRMAQTIVNLGGLKANERQAPTLGNIRPSRANRENPRNCLLTRKKNPCTSRDVM
jgi:hypothetical protein